MNNRILKNGIIIISLLLGTNETFAQMAPPGGGGSPVGGDAPLDDNIYLWLIPAALYAAYKIWQYYVVKKQIKSKFFI